MEKKRPYVLRPDRLQASGVLHLRHDFGLRSIAGWQTPTPALTVLYVYKSYLLGQYCPSFLLLLLSPVSVRRGDGEFGSIHISLVPFLA